ncbi:MAG: hypothetical protein WBF90_32140 [Rivularia sp. (in: cyanobacteria)]
MSHRIGDKEFIDIWIGLFTNIDKYGLAVIGKEKIVSKINKVSYEYWVIDILEGNFGYKSIIKNLVDWNNKYKQKNIIKNENEPVKKFLKEELVESYPKSRIDFCEYEFNPNHSIQALKGLLRDKKINVFKSIHESFYTALTQYDVDKNQVATINALMVALDKSYEKNFVRRSPVTSFCR